MVRSHRRWLALVPAAATWVVLAGGAACSGQDALLLCGQIPEGGCPIGRGGSCTDTTCAALYDCVSGAWKRVEDCPESATTTSASTGTGGSGPVCTPVMIDRSMEKTGCKPDLQTPDCPALAAESCTACEGCEDFFLCETDPMTNTPAWAHVAYCDATGNVVLSSQ